MKSRYFTISMIFSLSLSAHAGAFAYNSLKVLAVNADTIQAPVIEKVRVMDTAAERPASTFVYATLLKRLAERGLTHKRVVSDARILLRPNARYVLAVDKAFHKDPERDSFVLKFATGEAAQIVTFGAGWISLTTQADSKTAQYITLYRNGRITNTGVIPAPGAGPDPCGRVLNPEFCR